MTVGAFAAEVAFLNVFFRIVPRTAGIRHEYGEGETGSQAADQQAQYSGNPQHDPHDNRDDDGQQGWDDHFVLW